MIDRMMDSRGLDNFDLRFLGLIFAILGIGVLSIYSVTHDQGVLGFPFLRSRWCGFCLARSRFSIMLVSDYHRIARLAYPAYAIILILLAVVLFEGKTSRGAQRWIPIGPFAFQPSEFAKLVLILVMAHYYSKAPRVGWLQRVVIPGALDAAGAVVDPEAAGSRQRIELHGGLCRDAADGGHAVAGIGRDPAVFADAVSLRLGGHVGVIA